MPGGRPFGSVTKRTQEFCDLYDHYAEIYGDPVEVLFQIAFDEDADAALRKSSAADLYRMRYPQQKAIEAPQDKTVEVIIKRQQRRGGAGDTDVAAPSPQPEDPLS